MGVGIAGTRNDRGIVVDIGQLALRRLARIADIIGLIGDAGHLEIGVQLVAERAAAGQAQAAADWLTRSSLLHHIKCEIELMFLRQHPMFMIMRPISIWRDLTP